MSWLDSCIIMSRSIVQKHKRYSGNESLLSVSDNMAKTIWVDRSDWSFIFILTFFFRQGLLMTTGRSITDTQRTLLYTKFKEENDFSPLLNPLFPRRLIDFLKKTSWNRLALNRMLSSHLQKGILLCRNWSRSKNQRITAR